MMDFTLDTNDSFYQIRAYSPGAVKVNDTVYTESLIVTPTRLIHPFAPQSLDELTCDHLVTLATFKPQIILLGTGEKSALVSPHLLGPLLNLQIGIEVMNTAAACRTFNVLSAEKRHVLAALIIR